MLINILHTIIIVFFISVWSVMIDILFKNNKGPKKCLAILSFIVIMISIHVYDIQMINIYLNKISYIRMIIWFLLIYWSLK